MSNFLMKTVQCLDCTLVCNNGIKREVDFYHVEFLILLLYARIFVLEYCDIVTVCSLHIGCHLCTISFPEWCLHTVGENLCCIAQLIKV